MADVLETIFERYPKITIDGVDGVFTLMNDEGGDNGAVTTLEDFRAGVSGFGHMIDGVILRYRKEVCGRTGWHYVVEGEVE